MKFIVASLLLVFIIPLSVAKGVIRQSSLKVLLYNWHEFQVKAKSANANPYFDNGLSGKFVSPTGKVLVINGFYDGDDVWKLRFSPTETGNWQYEIKGTTVNYSKKGMISCIKSADKGFIGIHPKNKYAFAYHSGKSFFPMGDTSYGLYDDSPVTPELRAAYLQLRSKQGFNFIRMEVGHSVNRAAADPAYWAWGGSVQHPDLDRFNPRFFKGFDTLLMQMKSKHLNAELILLNFYRIPFTNTAIWTMEREQRWLKYLINRYAAFSNIFLWTVSNEYETHPDGAYRLDPSDVPWAIRTAQFIKNNDPYKHLTTVHSVISSSTAGTSPSSSINYPWRIGGFFGNTVSIDVLSQQTGQNGNGTTWNSSKGYWEGDDINLVNSVAADRIYNKPVLNSENGYEYLAGQPDMKRQVHATDKLRRSAWRITCAGGYFAAGFNGTLAHSDIWNSIDAPNKYTFSLKDEGAANQLSIMYRFFTGLDFELFHPYDAVKGDALALAGPKQYIILLPHGGQSIVAFPTKIKVNYRWFNPRTGIYGKISYPMTTSRLVLDAPDKLDWVAVLTRTQ
ncbi:MAG: DUF5060 domain-containing protein [Bacteroidota bacterium]